MCVCTIASYDPPVKPNRAEVDALVAAWLEGFDTCAALYEGHVAACNASWELAWLRRLAGEVPDAF